MGAIASGDVMLLKEDIIAADGVSQWLIDIAAAGKREGLRRRDVLYQSKRAVFSGNSTAFQPPHDVVAAPAASPEACKFVRRQCGWSGMSYHTATVRCDQFLVRSFLSVTDAEVCKLPVRAGCVF